MFLIVDAGIIGSRYPKNEDQYVNYMQDGATNNTSHQAQTMDVLNLSHSECSMYECVAT